RARRFDDGPHRGAATGGPRRLGRPFDAVGVEGAQLAPGAAPPVGRARFPRRHDDLRRARRTPRRARAVLVAGSHGALARTRPQARKIRGVNMDAAVRLYWEDAQRVEFDAEIRARIDVPGGTGLVLDRTAFYPTSGGQPHDTGTLDGVAVTDVFETEDGTIVHRLDAAPAGPRVHGRIDAVRRRDHMQQHSGQHLLSATLLALQGRDTLSFHLGRERCSIDLPGAALDDAAVEAAELRCNEIVWEARPVRARFLDAGEAAALRKAL